MHPRFQTAFAHLRITCNLHWNLFWQTSTSPFVDRGASLIAEERNGAGRRRLAFALLPLAAACARTPLSNLMLAQLRAV